MFYDDDDDNRKNNNKKKDGDNRTKPESGLMDHSKAEGKNVLTLAHNPP